MGILSHSGVGGVERTPKSEVPLMLSGHYLVRGIFYPFSLPPIGKHPKSLLPELMTPSLPPRGEVGVLVYGDTRQDNLVECRT